MKSLLTLKNLDGMVCTALELSGHAPTDLLLFPFGEWKGFVNPPGTLDRPRTISMNEIKGKQAISYAENQKKRNPVKQWPIDYEHQTLTGGEAPAAAWYSGLKLGSDGLYATGVEWTLRAKRMVEEKEYKYYSPWWWDQDVIGKPFVDKATGEKVPMAVFGAGLTNNPFIDDIPALVSTGNSHKLYIFNSHNFQQEEQMEPLLALLTAFFSLAATAKPDELVAKVNWLTEQLRAAGIVAKEGTVLTAQAVIDQIKLKFGEASTLKAHYGAIAKALGAVETDTIEQLVALIASAKDKTGFVARTEFDKLSGQIIEREVKEFLAANKKKITPAVYDQYLAAGLRDFEWLKATVAKMPDVINTDPIDPVTLTAKDDTSDDVQIGKQLGVTADMRKKYAAAQN